MVATDPAAAAALTGQSAVTMHGVVTYWWALDRPVPDTPFLWVDARAGRPGPVLNVSVIDAVAPSYAPPGRHLVAASTLHDGTTDEAGARRHAADILGIPSAGWDLLVRNVIPQALPWRSAHRCCINGSWPWAPGYSYAGTTETRRPSRARWSAVAALPALSSQRRPRPA